LEFRMPPPLIEQLISILIMTLRRILPGDRVASDAWVAAHTRLSLS